MRIALSAGSVARPRLAVRDATRTMPGRGAYLCVGADPAEPLARCLSLARRRNAIARAVAIGLLERTERRYYCAVSLPNILSPGKLCQRMLTSESTCAADLSEREWPASDAVMEH